MEKILRGEKVAYDGYLLNATELNDILTKAAAFDEVMNQSTSFNTNTKEYPTYTRGVRV